MSNFIKSKIRTIHSTPSSIVKVTDKNASRVIPPLRKVEFLKSSIDNNDPLDIEVAEWAYDGYAVHTVRMPQSVVQNWIEALENYDLVLTSWEVADEKEPLRR